MSLKTPPHPLTLELLEDVCRRLSLVSTARAQAIEADPVTSSKTGSKEPPRAPDLSAWAQQEFELCDTDQERLEVIKEAQDTWTALKYAPPAEQRRGTLPWKRAVATHGLIEEPAVPDGDVPVWTWAVPVRGVANIYSVSHGYVHRLRRDLINGRLEVDSVDQQG